MIVKSRGVPPQLLMLETLLRRLPANHSKIAKIKDKIGKIKAGIYGEEQVDYYLAELAQDQVLILQNVRMKGDTHYFQIDFIILFPTFILTLEVKNISGTIHYDSKLGQISRKLGEREDAYPNPFEQIARHKKLLSQWLIKNKLPNLPIESLIISANTNSILKIDTYHPEIIQTLVRIENINTKINQLMKRHQISPLTSKEMKRIAKLLVKNHVEYVPNILEIFEIKPNEIVTGVECPSCTCLPMKKYRGGWKCPKCSGTYRHAHLRALEDYKCLIWPLISRAEFQDYLHINSKTSATRLINEMGLKKSGTTKGALYEL